jgi:hypothetical protein
MRRTKSKITARPLGVARVVATLVTLGAAVVMTVAVLTDDTTLTLTAARVFVWAWLPFLALTAAERIGRKALATRARLRTGGRR